MWCGSCSDGTIVEAIMHQRMTLANAHPSGQRALLHADADARSTDTGARAASAAVLGGHRSGSSVRGAEGAACVVSGVRVDPNRALEGGLSAAVGEQVLLRAASTLTLHTAYRHASSCLLNEIGSNSLEDEAPIKPAISEVRKQEGKKNEEKKAMQLLSFPSRLPLVDAGICTNPLFCWLRVSPTGCDCSASF